ncbi:class I SAM-dependent methyltransferase [Candidatus Pelagibacter sp.]|nr:class I SAM-dependent methyltransferase [Candidatus Pelagibacter sp.]
MKNYYKDVVEGFGKEWTKFNYSNSSIAEQKNILNNYFKIFPWDLIDKSKSVGIDIGCGSGRWAYFISEKTSKLILLDASSSALEVAKKNLEKKDNVSFLNQSVGEIKITDNSIDFAYSLGVLHHIPDISNGLREINRIIKPGSPLLLYLYYNFDNKPVYYKVIWMVTNPLRFVISRLPFKVKFLISQVIAFFIYFPLARLSKLLKKLGLNTENFPMNQYQDLSLYVMRTDALDRFGTKIEKRFSRKQIQKILEESNFENIKFSEDAPYWCCVGYKKK